MRKLVLSLLTMTISIASTTGVISCISAGYTQGEIGERIIVITDSGRITDRSFNQSAYEAVWKYSDRAPVKDEQGNITAGGFDFENRGLNAKTNYVEPITADAFSLISAYKIAIIKGTDILVLPGFQHAATVDQAATLIGNDKTVIFADSDAGTKPNIINLLYNSQLAGFAAGYDACVWATTRDSNGKFLGAINGNDYVSFGTYGGISSKLAVDNYMWGFMLAIRVFNLKIASDPNQDQARHVYFANVGKKGEVENANQISGTNLAYFTGSFEPGGSTKAGTNQLLYQNQADVIFPIAGPQTADTLAYSDKAYIIGVDTDQTFQYSRYANRFVTSALKNLTKSIDDALDHSQANRLNHNEDGSLKRTPVVGGEYWEGEIAPAQVDWSIDVDQTMNPQGSKIPKTLFDYSDPKWKNFIEELNNYYLNEAGEDISSYMSPSIITTMAQKILNTKEYNDLLPLSFDN